jgi:hypothetical protein
MTTALTTGTTGAATAQTGAQAKAAPASGGQRAVPWIMAALECTDLQFATGPTTLEASTAVPLPVQLLLSDAWLMWLELIVTITAAGNSASAAFAADAPFSAIQSFQVQDPGGAQIIAPHSGYDLYLKQKYGAFRIDPPSCDPRLDPMYFEVTGTGATGGSAQFRLMIPFAIRPVDAYAALANADSSRQYRVSITLAPESQIYTTNPSNAPTVSIAATGYYRLNPPASLAGVPAQQNPPWYTPNGAARAYLDVINPPVPSSVAGSIGLQYNIQGRVIREIILVARNSSGARVGVGGDGNFPTQSTWVFNKFPRFVLNDVEWWADMADAFQYTAVSDALNTYTVDAAGTLDTGVRVLHQFMLSGNGRVRTNQTAFGWLQTVAGSQILQQGEWGSSVASITALVTDIAPGPVPSSLFVPTAIA